MGTIETGFDSRDSVELKMSSKGDMSWNIKIYFNNEERGSDKVLDDLEAIHNALKERFL
jgi:hypothetical protein